MAGQKGLFKTSIGRKNLMAFTGLFMSFFLIIHLAGNLILIIPDSWFPIEFWGGVANQHDMYNAYSHFLVSFWPVEVVAWVLYLSIIVHAIDALLLTINNRKTAGDKYVKFDASTSKWYSRFMGVLGSVLLLFIVFHMSQFWLPYKIIGGGKPDLYELVIAAFKQEWVVIVYLVSIISLGYHLLHGVESAFRSLGLYGFGAMKVAKYFSLIFAAALTVLYAIIPIVVYLS